jgi:hypothetical protein
MTANSKILQLDLFSGAAKVTQSAIVQRPPFVGPPRPLNGYKAMLLRMRTQDGRNE